MFIRLNKNSLFSSSILNMSVLLHKSPNLYNQSAHIFSERTRLSMGKFDSLINAANKAMDSAETLLDNPNTPFNVMYKQYKTLQSFWFRVIEDAAETNSGRLEDLCVDLEDVMQRCSQWIKDHSQTKEHPTADESDKDSKD